MMKKNSSLSGCDFIRLRAENREGRSRAFVLFSFENLIGTGGSMTRDEESDMKHDFIMNSWNPGFVWCDCRTNYETAGQLPEGEAIWFGTKEDHNDPASCGDYTMLCGAGSYDGFQAVRLGCFLRDGKRYGKRLKRPGELEDRAAKKGG